MKKRYLFCFPKKMEVLNKMIKFNQIRIISKNENMGIKEFEDDLNQDENAWIENNLSDEQKFNLEMAEREIALKKFQRCANGTKSIEEFEKFLLDEKAWIKQNDLESNIKQVEKVDRIVLERLFKSIHLD